MTLTVRLDSALDSALERYCTEHGVSKSLVVQECLAGYLAAGQARSAKSRASMPANVPVSANYRAFADAGFVGAAELGAASADKATVRARAMQRVARRSK